MIPKRIHYIWFGERDIPDNLKKYMSSWNILKNKGYEICCWNEKNLPIDKAPAVVQAALKLKKYAFAADYFRLRVLYESGGIYFDTDIEVKKDFAELLNTGLLLGFIYDASIGTAVIGAEKENSLIKSLIDLYETADYEYNDLTKEFLIKFKMFPNQKLINNNDLLTGYFLKCVSDFHLNGKEQHIGNISIYPKEYFEGYTFNKDNDYTVHHCDGSWRNKNSKRNQLKLILEKFTLIWTIRDIYVRRKMNMYLPYTKQYLEEIGKCDY